MHDLGPDRAFRVAERNLELTPQGGQRAANTATRPDRWRWLLRSL